MQREIKFRALTLDAKAFVYGSLILGKQFSGALFAQIENADANDYQQYQVDPKTIGQFIFRKDKNGKEIYEGDIVRLKNKPEKPNALQM